MNYETFMSELDECFPMPSIWPVEGFAMTRAEHLSCLLGQSVRLTASSVFWTVVQVDPSTSIVTLKLRSYYTPPSDFPRVVIAELKDLQLTRSPSSLYIRWSLLDQFGRPSGHYLESAIAESSYHPTYEFAQVTINE